MSSINGYIIEIDSSQQRQRPRKAIQLNIGTFSNHASWLPQLGHRDRGRNTERSAGQHISTRPGLGGQSAAFVADDESKTRGTIDRIDRIALRIGRPKGQGMRSPERVELVPGAGKTRVVEVGAHPATDDLSVP
jgi:hypothetical protein